MADRLDEKTRKFGTDEKSPYEICEPKGRAIQGIMKSIRHILIK